MARLYAVLLAITVIAIFYVPTTAYVCCKDESCSNNANCKKPGEVCQGAPPLGCAVPTTDLKPDCKTDEVCFCNTDKCNQKPPPPPTPRAPPASKPSSSQSFALPVVTAALAAIMLFVL
uniref:Uncharacterized protein n=1 Tax=Panagrellus redivivus TaxID=6233 RepID=A0A7E4VTV1_PANRE